jgi:hypothetical protein
MHRAAGFICWVGLSLSAPIFAQTPFAWKDLGEGRLQLEEAGRPALVYNYGPQLKAGAPETSRRCCYVYPLYTPGGVSVLEDFPPGEWHHRGLYWAWPVVEVGGRQYDLWLNMTVHQRTVGKPTTIKQAQVAQMVARSVWEAGGRDIVRETLQLSAARSEDGARYVEAALTWEAIAAPVTLRGAREAGKSYGGFAVAFAPSEGTELRSESGPIEQNEDLKPHLWVEWEGAIGGKKAAARVIPNAGLGPSPFQWCLRMYGFVGASFPGKTDAADGYTIEPGKPLVLRLGVRVADGK